MDLWSELAHWLGVAPRRTLIEHGSHVPNADSSITSDDLPDGGATTSSRSRPAPLIELSRLERQRIASRGLGRRIVHAPAALAVSSGWEVHGDGIDAEEVEDLDYVHGAAAAARDAIALARQDGVAWWLVMSAGMDPSQPLPPGPHEIEAIQVVSYREAIPLSWDVEPTSPTFGQPLTFSVLFQRDNVTVPLKKSTVHRSHLVRWCGLTVDPTQRSPLERPGADQSAVEAYWPYLADYELTGGSLAQIARMLTIPFVKLADKVTAGAGMKLRDYLELLTRMRRSMGAYGLTVLRPGDEMGLVSPSLTGLKDLSAAQYERLSSVEGAPVEWLLGMRVGGIGADASGQAEQLRQFASGLHTEVLRPALLEWYTIALGADPKRRIEFHPTNKPTALEIAQLEKARAEAAALRIASGITTAEQELRHLCGDDAGDLPREFVDEYVAPLDGLTDAEARAAADRLRVVR